MEIKKEGLFFPSWMSLNVLIISLSSWFCSSSRFDFFEMLYRLNNLCCLLLISILLVPILSF